MTQSSGFGTAHRSVVSQGDGVPPARTRSSVGEGEVGPPHLSSEPERFATTATGTINGLHLGWSHAGGERPAFQMCLARAVTGPERFKGGTCSFGAPAMHCWELSRADSNGRYAVGAAIIARIPLLRQGGGSQGPHSSHRQAQHPVAGLLR
ncbi:hypothetical protein STVIR_2378 [Streptomyces viridochromogenes Tue57]|uniref:Uncharacterized protein n=1 Tax=Streptomyces viridochromogenes Tue57 TaxID=1160705 RepID=L8PMF2_STRVR|nr:hypothetical protein STVIR_2378 [Streptomyces viridochromogenes Tue57]